MSPSQISNLLKRYRYCTWWQIANLQEDELERINADRMTAATRKECEDANDNAE